MSNLDEIRKKKIAQASNAKLYQDNMAMLGFGAPPVAPQPTKTKAAPAKKVAKKVAPNKISESEELIGKLTALPDEVEYEDELMVEELEDTPSAMPEAIPERAPAAKKGYDLGGWEDVAAIGAAPLLSILTGASPTAFNMQMDKANASAKIIGDEARVTKDKITVLEDENGSPVNALIKDSLGKKPFYQKKTLGSGGNAREFAPIGVKNIRTGEVLPAKVTGNGYVRVDSGELFDSNWLPFRKDDLIREKTLQGGSKVTARESYTGKLKGVSSQAGIGNVMGGIPKELANSSIKQAEQSKGAVVKTNEALDNAKFAYDMLGDTNITAQKAASAMTILAKAINKDKVSDADFVHLQGAGFKSYITQVEEWSISKVGNRPPPEALAAFRQLAKEIVRMKQSEIGNIKDIYNPKGAVPAQGQKIIDGITGGNQPAAPAEDWRNKYKRN